MKLFKKVACVTIACCMMIQIPNMQPHTANASTISELQAKRDALAATTNAAKKEIESLQAKSSSVTEEISALDKVLVSLEAELQAAQSDLKTIETNLANAEYALAETTEKREHQFELLGGRLNFLQQKGSTGYFEILMESESFADLFIRMQYVNDIMTFDRNLLNDLQDLQESIRLNKIEIEESKEAQIIVVDLETAKVNEMDTLITQKEKILASYQSDIAKNQEVVSINEKADNDIIALIKAEEEKQKAAAAAASASAAAASSSSSSSSVVYTGNGSLGWPVPSKAASASSLSSGYVNRTNPVTGVYESHKGYDIPASYGAAIVAAEAGRVTYAGWMNGYGNTVVIDHGSGLSTLYAHNSSLTVSTGQTVSKGQTVAKCGSTGLSTGNHLHFSVLKNGAYVHPNTYLGF